MKITTIVLATGNETKAAQIAPIFPSSRFSIITASKAGVTTAAKEDGKTFRENAGKKARHVYDLLREKTWVMADDSGVEMRALDWLPGVITANWAGEGKTELETMTYALRQMEGQKDRVAVFRTVACLISPDGKEHAFIGDAWGTILTAPRCAPQKSMPYSPIFVPDEGFGKSWAEMSIVEENRISHRGKAFRQVLEFMALAVHR